MKLSIRYKFIVGLLCIFCIGFNLLSFVTNKIVIENNKKVVTKELLNQQRDSVFFIRQYLKLNDIDENVQTFNQKVGDVASALSLKLDDRVIMYSKDGKFLFDTAYEKGKVFIYDNENGDGQGEYIKDNKKDLKLAIKNTSSYSILKSKNRYIVCFSYPIYINNNKFGIVRYIKDYSDIFKSGEYLLKLIKISMLAIFGMIFLFSVVLTTSITIPIIKLNKVSKEISKGNYDVSLNINSRDEVGELAESFTNMKECIKEQIETIEKDRDNLKKLESHRKTFFDNVTHEMKTPLTIISGYTQIIGDKGFNDEKFFKKSVKRIKYEADRMHNMVLNLLDISKLESNTEHDFQKINISQIACKICEEMKIKSEKYYISIEKSIKDDVYILGDEEQMVKVFINIIDNAIKYGKIQSKIKVSVTSDEDMCFITVEDEGKGIPQDKLDKIFEPFYRVDKSFSRENGSSGLGLSIVKNIVVAHKGQISIESKENLGTKVKIKIPFFVYNLATSV
ncbi:ATP-binding protein [Haloimpatiens sp. FM7330]|uniref:HAMP domain-containing sensor histidine kinase n=1 Tax=Haloimpatiens sp. FM7330 TaxID=3298610 RepID=UPI00363F44D2